MWRGTTEVHVDRDLVERAKGGDRDAFASLVHQVSDGLFMVAHRILRDVGLAEDAVQDTLLTIWRQLPQLRDPDRFEAWSRRILVHACYAEARRSRRWTANIRTLDAEPAVADGTAMFADRDELDRIFKRLPLEQRAVFVLHHLLGLPLVEVAETLRSRRGPLVHACTTRRVRCASPWSCPLLRSRR